MSGSQKYFIGSKPSIFRAIAWIALAILTVLSIYALTSFIGGFFYEPVGTNQMLVEADPNMPPIYSESKVNLFSDPEGKVKIGWLDKNFAMRKVLIEGNYTLVQGYVWIWRESTKNIEGVLTVKLPKENVRIRTNSDKIGELISGTQLKHIWTNHTKSWSLAEFEAWVPSSKVSSQKPSGWFQGPRVTFLFEREGDVHAKYRFDAIWPLIPTVFMAVMMFLFLVRGAFLPGQRQTEAHSSKRVPGEIKMEIFKASLAIVTGVIIAFIIWAIGIGGK